MSLINLNYLLLAYPLSIKYYRSAISDQWSALGSYRGEGLKGFSSSKQNSGGKQDAQTISFLNILLRLLCVFREDP